MVQQKYPDRNEASILQMEGINFDHGDTTVVLVRTDIFPEEYMPYLETHEKWEVYVARKPGYNLFKKSVKEYKEEKNIETFDDKTRGEFYRELDVYNYDFHHELAIYKEYKDAVTEGKLKQYHTWVMNLRERKNLMQIKLHCN
jgi:hypothetical protein